MPLLRIKKQLIISPDQIISLMNQGELRGTSYNSPSNSELDSSLGASKRSKGVFAIQIADN